MMLGERLVSIVPSRLAVVTISCSVFQNPAAQPYPSFPLESLTSRSEGHASQFICLTLHLADLHPQHSAEFTW